jgi:RNA polymerase-binding transcription factor
MEPERARELLARERSRVERELSARELADPDQRAGREPGDEGSEDLFETGLDDARREQLQDELTAVARAEERLAAGTYGFSVESGEPIPDQRLEVLPTAERTVGEDEGRRSSSSR